MQGMMGVLRPYLVRAATLAVVPVNLGIVANADDELVAAQLI